MLVHPLLKLKSANKFKLILFYNKTRKSLNIQFHIDSFKAGLMFFKHGKYLIQWE